jgi:hypothetical protein
MGANSYGHDSLRTPLPFLLRKLTEKLNELVCVVFSGFWAPSTLWFALTF